MSTLFLSDLHLEDKRPETLELLLEVLHGPARLAESLYILGDLFEYWIGDDALSQSAQLLAGQMRELSDSGVACYFMHGNRDFLLGEHYAQQAGLRLLPESCVIELYGTPTLLLHGDTLCTDDAAYQAIRLQTRDPAWQAGVLALTIPERLQMAQEARVASKAHTSSASMDIMDVNQDAVRGAFRESGVTRMIHGHTHRPAFHKVDLENGKTGERIVLADWYRSGSYLEVSSAGIQSIDL